MKVFFILFLLSKLWHTATPSKISIFVTVNSIRVQEIQVEDGRFARLEIAETGNGSDIGSPNLPVIRKLIKIPEAEKVELEIAVIKERELLLSHPMFPVQLPVPKIQGARPEFTINREFYKQDKFMPQEWAKITGVGYIRGHRVAIIEIYPVRYNPFKNKVIYSKEIQLNINISHPDVFKTGQIQNRYYSPPFEELASNIIMNYKDAGDKPPHYSIGYLIICGDDWYDNVLNFAEWKSQQGFDTTIIRTSEIPGGMSVENLIAYIEDAYYNWPIPPTYVLFVGDVNTIPAPPGTTSIDAHPSATDLYYTLISGGDYFPDIGIGRLSVEDTTQANAVIEKIINFEYNQESEAWRNRAYFMASDDAGNHGIAEGTHNYCMQVAREYGMICDSLYAYDAYGGTPITTAINSGRLMAVYSGHGGIGGWGGPSFSQSNVTALSNLEMYPLVLSHACFTGTYSSNCFGETWLRAEDKGASAFWGASCYTYWDEDDTLQRAMFNALFYDSLTWLSGMMDYAKYKVWEAGFWGWKYYYEVYNLLGDPSMRLFTYPLYITIDPESLEVDVSTNVAIIAKDSSDNPISSAVVKISGLGVNLIDTTDLTGTCVFLIDPPYGEILQVVARKGMARGEKCLPVIGAQSFDYVNIIPETPELDLIDSLIERVQGTITGKCSEAGFELRIKGCEIDTGVTIPDTSGSIFLMPLSTGELQTAIVKKGYEAYVKSVKVVSFRGIVKGVVEDISDHTFLFAFIQIYKNGNFYTSIYTDSISGEYEIILPGDNYTFLVSNPDYIRTSRDIQVDTVWQIQKFELSKASGILVIDDSSSGSADTIFQILDTLGYTVTLEPSNLTNPDNWSNYKLIVWSSGDNEEPIKDELKVDELISYSKEGRRLFVEGGEIGKEALSYYPSFATQGLHITECLSDSGGSLILSNVSHPLVNIPNELSDTISCSYSNYGTQDVLLPDSLTDLVYSWADSQGTGGIFASEGKTVFFSFDIKRVDNKAELIENTVYFLMQAGVEEPTEFIPKVSKICLVGPNPFTQKVLIKYQIANVGKASLRIYDLAGRLVKSFPLVTNHLSLTTAVSWDGRDERGKKIGAGIYFLKFETQSHSETKKIVFLK
ncbi:T9SS type A sorting domain-containing protein [candidate division WOR-3 bacterium]|nr:T9SS type A sorting domain-containing protein [candidate division WOR-3 bacterium]